jgi:hypothetical protein
MKLERRKFHYQGYYNSIHGCPVPCECVLEYIEPIEVEALELAVERATANMVAAQNRAAELEKELGNLTMHHYNLGQKHDILVLKNRGLTNRIVNLLGEIIAELTNPYHSPWDKIDNITCIARETMEGKDET